MEKTEKSTAVRKRLKFFIIAIVLIALLTSGMPLTAYADVDISAPILIHDWEDLRAAVGNSSQSVVRIRLVSDVGIPSGSGNAHNAGNTVEIDLDGHTIFGNGRQAFWNEKGTMTVKNGSIINGKSDYGGAINNRDTLILEDVEITGCVANEAGGGIMNYGTLTMTGGKIADCQAGRGGGLRVVPHGSDSSAAAQAATATLTNVEISGNTVDGRTDNYGRGGGIGVTRGTLTMTGCTVSGNKSTNDDGGGIDFDSDGKTLTLMNTTISDNSVTKAERQGGGLNLERGTANITGCTISGNSAPDGGGIFIPSSFGTTTLSGTTVENNQATAYGGGGINNKSILTIKDNSVIRGNTSKAGGGGIYSVKNLVVSDSKILDNTCLNADADGGGVMVAAGSAFFSSVTVSGNSASDGAGICITSSAYATVSGTSFISNNSTPLHSGGGIFTKGSLTLSGDITISGNTAKENGGGIYYNGSSLRMEGKVVVSDNTGDEKVNNIYVFDGKTIKVTGAIDDASSIGVTMASGRYVITDGFKDSGNTKAQVFTSDDGRGVLLNEDGEVRLSAGGATSMGGILNRVTVTIHPAGQDYTLNIRDNGRTAGQNVVQLFNIGDTQRFWLTSADDESYYIDYFNGADDYSPSTKRFDIESNDDYMRVGSVVHVVKGNQTATNKRWRFIRNDDGTYYIQNVRSNLFWALEDGYKNKSKLCQKTLKDAQKWEIEIVAADGEIPIEELKEYDSFTYSPAGEQVSSCDWMSHLPDDMLLSDISIPGTHDASTAHVTTSVNSSGQCQNLSIYDQLNNGIRYLDLRLGGGDDLKMVHGDKGVYCKFNGEQLYLTKVMDWIFDFLDRHPGETVILQPKEDLGGNKTRKALYEYYQKIAMEQPDRIYIGDHVPTLGEARGKIVILSRIRDYGNKDFAVNGGQWAIDCTGWKARRDSSTYYDPLGLAASGDNYEVWTQDDFDSWDISNDKWDLIYNSVFDHTTGAEAKRNAVKDSGKEAWVVSYTSGTHWYDPDYYPQQLARLINPKLKKQLMTDSNVLNGQFLGVVCSDFSDEQLAYLVYKQNFIYDQKIIRGITVDGEEPFQPLTVYIPKGENTADYLAGMRDEIDSYFTNEKYVPYGAQNRDKIEQLKIHPMIAYPDAETYAAFPETEHSLSQADTLYVALDTKTGLDQLLIELPKCGTEVTVEGNLWTGQTNRPKVYPETRAVKVSTYWVTDEDADQLYSGTIGTGPMIARIELSLIWGYAFDGTDGQEVLIENREGNGRFRTALPLTADNFGDEPLVLTGIPIAHQKLKLVEGTPATCAEAGILPHYYCETCGNNFADSTCANALEEADLLIARTDLHTPGEVELENVTLPTCTEAGSYDQVITCTVCGKELSRKRREVKALGHSWDEGTVTTEQTCTEAGTKTYTCTRDNSHTMTEEIDAYGHDWSEWTVTEEATDEEEGTEERTCLRCNETETRAIPLEGHVHELEHFDAKEETCKEYGNIEYWYCEGCGKYFLDAEALEELNEEDVFIPADHDWDDGKVTKEPSCTENGEMTYTCKRDASHIITEVILATGHQPAEDFTYEPVSEATCTQPAYQYRASRCAVCDGLLHIELIESGKPLGHDWGETEYTWADDLSSVTAKRVCSRDDSHVEMEIADTAAVTEPATCEAAGKITYTATFKNEAFEEQTKVVELPALGHDWDEGKITTEATCTEDGEMTYTCKHDASHTKTEVIPATGHVERTRVTENTATCTEEGVQTIEHYCSVCGEVLSTETEETKPLGHTWAEAEYTWNLEGDDPTLTAVTHCEVCEETLTKTVKVKYDDTYCLRTWYIDMEEPIDSDTSEYLKYFELQETEEILEDKHDWGDWEVTVEPTCTKPGEETRVCQFVEFHVQTQAVDSLGHDWDEATYSWSKDYSTCTAARVCMRDATHVETETVDSTYIATKEPTCEDMGVGTFTAEFKNEAFATQITTGEIEPLGHDWGEWTVTKKATTTATGEYTRVCNRDQTHTETKEIPVMSVTAPEAVSGLVYTGAAQELVTAGSVEGGVMQYAIGENGTAAPETGWSETIPSGIDAGTYDVWYKAAGDEEHEDTAPTALSVSIAKKNVDAPAAESKVYNGSTQTADVEDSDLYSVKTNDGGIDAGIYDVVLALKDSTNYKWKDSDNAEITITFTITKQTSNKVTVSIDNWAYGETAKTPVVTATYGTAECTYSKEEAGPYTADVPSEVGHWFVKAEVAETDSYPGASATAKFEITKGKPVVEAPVAVRGLVYTGAAQELVTAGSVEGGTLQYAIGKNDKTAPKTGWSKKIPAGTEVGTYTVWYKTVGDKNYEDIAPKALTVRIAPANIKNMTCTLAKTSYVYTGKEITPAVTVKAGTAILKSGTDYTVSYKKNIAVGTATVTITGKGNYSGTVTKTFTITDRKIANITLSKAVIMPARGTYQLKVLLTPSNTSQTGITWTSSDKSIATVDRTGKITGVARGKATITATSTADSRIKVSCEVTVLFADATHANVSETMFTAIYWAADQHITNNKVKFGTKDSMTRGQFVRFLYRYAGSPKVTSAMIRKYGKQFKDVDDSYTHYKAIVWAVSEGLIDGYYDGTFRPEDSLSRQNVATILWKFAGSPNIANANDPFPDVAKSKAIAWGKNRKIFNGTAFHPNDDCLRGSFAVFLYRYDQKVANK